jgi:hypothetical protein
MQKHVALSLKRFMAILFFELVKHHSWRNDVSTKLNVQLG